MNQKYEDYKDNLKQHEQEKFTAEWMQNAWDLLSANGILALHGPDDLAELYLRFGSRLGGFRTSWVSWHYRFGQCGRGNWIDARCHCLIYAKGKDFIWNPEAVLVESDRSSTYGDKRIHETENGGKRLPGTIWGVPSDGPFWGRVQGNNAERWCKKTGAPIDHPNQLPIVYIARLLKAYTNPGSRVCDLFCGSGTVPLTCQALDRNCLSVDIGKNTVESARQRLKAHAKIAKERVA